MDDLDDLMAQLDNTPSTPAQASQAQGRPTQQRSVAPARGGDDDLDALMMSIGGGGGGASQPARAPQAQPARGGGGGDDDLDALMASIGGGGGGASQAPRAAPAASQAGGGGYGGGAPAAAKPKQYGAVNPMGGDDINDLINNIGGQMKDVGGTPSGKGVCAWCKQPILGEKMDAMGRVYHPDHFCCVNCHEPIGTGQFYDVESQPHCSRCYNNMFCPRCAHCDQVIEGQCVAALGKKWHPDHFVCSTCLAPFNGGSFFERDGLPYCETHFYSSFCPTCAACDQPIRGDCINALGQQWHIEHWVCTYCHAAFGGNPYFEHNGKPYCKLHYNQTAGSMCAGCNKSIEGRAVQACGKKWHPEHFVCAFCMQPLPGTSFTENAGKAYCKTCHGKLFA